MKIGADTRQVDRFQLAALVDRLIYGSPDTFNRSDAIALYEMIPTEMKRGGLSNWFQISAKGSTSGSSRYGVAAGVGNARLPEDERSFEFDSAGRRVLRAGQWKLYSIRNAIEIEQVMATDIDEGKSARLIYRAGEPERMELLMHRRFSLGFISFVYGTFRPWKSAK